MTSLPAWTLILTFFLPGAGPALAGDWTGKTVTIDGIAHVQNPAEPAESERVLTPERLWSIGGDSDDDDEIFGAITEILTDGDGNTYLLDSQILQVMVFGPDGEFLHTFGRGGEGPGEFRMPSTMFFLPGGHLGVAQSMPTRVVVFNLEGEPQPDFPIPDHGGFSFVQAIESAGDHVVISVQNSSFDDSKITIEGKVLRLDSNGDSLSTLWTRERERNMSKMVIGRNSDAVLPHWTLGSHGNVFFSSIYNDYRIEEIGIDGKIVRIIEREYESRKRTDEELAEMEKRMNRMPQSQISVEIKFDATDRDIVRFFPRDNGELWVMSSRSIDVMNEGGLGIFEVFDREGRYVRDVRVDADIEKDVDIWHINEDRLYIIKRGMSAIKSAYAGMLGTGSEASEAEDEEEDLLPPEVVCYQLGC